jgi:alpha-beta hydrolase superfamily lysophospholipase
VIVGAHGFNDYANAFHLAAPWWAKAGVSTYAYDQRGFGRAPGRGLWAGDEVMARDLTVLTELVRARHPKAVLAVAGESMGGAVAIRAFASETPPPADRLVLLAPAVWGWSSQPLPNRTLLWLSAHVAPGYRIEPPEFVVSRVRPTDNLHELAAMGRDPHMIWGARIDSLFGLTEAMQAAWASVGGLRIPPAYLYGGRDDIIPKGPSFEAASRLPPGSRTAYYRQGHHLLMRDMEGWRVWADILAYLRDLAAPWPSGAEPIPHKGAARVAEERREG